MLLLEYPILLTITVKLTLTVASPSAQIVPSLTEKCSIATPKTRISQSSTQHGNCKAPCTGFTENRSSMEPKMGVFTEKFYTPCLRRHGRECSMLNLN